MPPSDSIVRAIFDRALEIQDAARRSAYLVQACGDDPELRREVEQLLAAEASASRTFLPDRPTNPNLEPVFSAAVHAAGERREGALTVGGWEQPGDRIGRYKLLKQIGEGAAAWSIVAEQEQPVRRRVALKVIKLGMDTKTGGGAL